MHHKYLKLLTVFQILLLTILTLFLTCNLALSDELADPEEDFIFRVCDDHVEIDGYIGDRQTVVVPATIQGKAVTQIKLGKSERDDIPEFFPYVRKVVLPETIEVLDDYCFGGFSNLEEVIGLENVVELRSNIFDCSSLRTAVFSDKLKRVSQYAFAGNYMLLEELTIPDDFIFDETYGLYIPFSLQSLHLVRGTGEATLHISDDVLFSANQTTLICVLPYKNTTIYEIPEGVTTLSYLALSLNNYIVEYQFPASLTTIYDNDAIADYLIMDVYPDSVAYHYFIKLKEKRTDSKMRVRVLGEEGEQGFQELTQTIISETVTETMTDYQKARALHDWICEHTTYDYTLTLGDAVDVFWEGQGVCAAYSRAYSILLAEVGIENKLIECGMTGILHMINAVKLDGKWYLVDCTNDDETAFGYPDELFCFNQDIYDQFYTGQLPIEVNDLSLYAPYVNGSLDAPLTQMESIITSKIESGFQSFIVEIEPQLTVGKIPRIALCSMINQMHWTVNGKNIGVICTTENGRTFICRVVSDYEYVYEENNDGIWLKKYMGEERIVHVPAEINGKPVLGLRNTFEGNTTIHEVILPEGITEIGDKAFYQCTALEMVNFPASLTRIGDNAFRGCTSLERSIALPDGLKEIGDAAFSFCIFLEEIEIPGSVELFGKEWFSGCIKLSRVVLDEGINEVPEAAFLNCSKLNYIRLPQSIQTIRNSAFIGSGIVSLNIPQNVSLIEWGAFLNTTRLKTVTVSPDNTTYTSQDNILFSKDMSKLIMAMGKVPDTYVVPDGVGIIGEWAFAQNDDMRKDTIPSTSQAIEAYAFSMSAVEEVVIEDGLTSIGEYAFSPLVRVGTYYYRKTGLASNLRHIRLPETLTSIGEGAFLGNASLAELVLPASLETVNVWFINYPLRLYIPEGITYIAPQETQEWFRENEIHGRLGTYAEQYAAENGYQFIDDSDRLCLSPDDVYLLPGECCSLQIVTLNGNGTEIPAEQVAWMSDSNCVSVENGAIHALESGKATVSASYQGVSGNCYVHVYTLLGDYPFHLEIDGDTEFLRVGEERQACAFAAIPTEDEDEVEAIDITNHVQWKVSNPDVLELGTSGVIKAIGPGICDIIAVTPDGRELRQTFTVVGRRFDPGADPYIRDRLTRILYLPGEVKLIEEAAFRNGTFEEVIIPNGCTEIGGYAFSDNSMLQAVIIPESILEIDGSAFSNCPNVVLFVHNQYAEQYAVSHHIAFIKDY